MKKLLAILLTAAMLLSLVIVATVSVAAEDENDGMWTTMVNASQYDADYFDDERSIPGYEYSERGFEMVPGDWSTSTPFATIQSKEKVNIKQGVYMEVRIDEFSYDAGDKWFNFNIWDSVGIEPGNIDMKYGSGVQTLLRPTTLGPDANAEKTTTGGSVPNIYWYTNAFAYIDMTTIDLENRTAIEEDGVYKDVFTLEISWDAANNTYVLSINGSAAPQKVIDYMNTKFAGGEAYIGFTTQNAKKGGTIDLTITKFGTSKETATVPYGVDYKEPENFDNTIAPIMDPSTVPAGQPAILMTGDRDTSDLKNKPVTSTGTNISVADNGNIQVTAVNSVADFGILRVDNDKSYDVKDFPIIVCVTKNWCSCEVGDHTECLALESMTAYVLTGEHIAPGAVNAVLDVEQCYDPIIIGDDNYLYFWIDCSELGREGRFNGVRFDANNVDLVNDGFNSFEMLWTGLFRNTDEAAAYLNAYFDAIEEENAANPDVSEDSTDAGVGDTTEADTNAAEGTQTTTEDTAEVTEATQTNGADQSAEATEGTAESTAASTTDNNAAEGETTEAKADADDATDENGGCGSFVGFGAVAMIAVTAVAGVVSFKKKED